MAYIYQPPTFARITETTPYGDRLVRQHFNSCVDLAEWYVSKTAKDTGHYVSISERTGLDSLRRGNSDPRLMALVNRTMQQCWDNIPTLSPQWQYAVVGPYGNIGAALQGVPECMLVQDEDESEHTPVRIFCGGPPSGGVTDEQISIRGAALAALATILAQVRPVYLVATHSMGNNYNSTLITVNITPSPLVMSEVIANLVDANVIRNFSFELQDKLNPGTPTGWAPWERDVARMRKILHATDDDLVFPPVHLHDPLTQDPVGQVRLYIEKYIKLTDETSSGNYAT